MEFCDYGRKKAAEIASLRSRMACLYESVSSFNFFILRAFAKCIFLISGKMTKQRLQNGNAAFCLIDMLCLRINLFSSGAVGTISPVASVFVLHRWGSQSLCFYCIQVPSIHVHIYLPTRPFYLILEKRCLELNFRFSSDAIQMQVLD